MEMKLEIELKAKCCGQVMKQREIIDVNSKQRSTLLECKNCMQSVELEGIYINHMKNN
jgi:hypothetical protein